MVVGPLPLVSRQSRMPMVRSTVMRGSQITWLLVSVFRFSFDASSTRPNVSRPGPLGRVRIAPNNPEVGVPHRDCRVQVTARVEEAAVRAVGDLGGEEVR